MPIANGIIPIGGIVPFWFDGSEQEAYGALERSWALCDGKPLNGSHPREYQQSEVDSRFWNVPSPDLRDRFVKGAGVVSHPGHAAGNNAATRHHHTGVTGHSNQQGPSQGARLGCNNGVTLPEAVHSHSFVTGDNTDAGDPWGNAPAFLSMYLIMRVK